MTYFFFSSRRRHTRLQGDWSSDVCSSDLDSSSEAPARSAAPDEIRAALAALDPDELSPKAALEALYRLRRLLEASERSEERRVGKECRSWWSPYHLKKNKWSK